MFIELNYGLWLWQCPRTLHLHFCPVSICRPCFRARKASPHSSSHLARTFSCLHSAQMAPAHLVLSPSALPGHLVSIKQLSSLALSEQAGDAFVVSLSMSSLGVKTGAHSFFLFFSAMSVLGELNFISRSD